MQGHGASTAYAAGRSKAVRPLHATRATNSQIPRLEAFAADVEGVLLGDEDFVAAGHEAAEAAEAVLAAVVELAPLLLLRFLVGHQCEGVGAGVEALMVGVGGRELVRGAGCFEA